MSRDQTRFIQTGIVCQGCGKESIWPVRHLLSLHRIPCRFCGADINLQPKRADLEAIAQRYRELERLLCS